VTHRLLPLAAAAIVLALAAPAQAATHSTDDGRPGAGQAWRPGEVVVRFSTALTDAQRLRILERVGATRRSPLSSPGAELVIARRGSTVPATVRALERHRDVRWAEPNYVAVVPPSPTSPGGSATAPGSRAAGPRAATPRAAAAATDPFWAGSALRKFFSADSRRGHGQWGLRRIGVAKAWSALKAPGRWRDTRIAVIDSGIDFAQPDFAAARFTKIPAGTTYPGTALPIKQDALELHPTEPAGHGTGTAGVIGATVDNGIGIAGVNPRTEVLALATDDAVTTAEAIRYAVDQGVTIINWSSAYDIPDHGGGIPTTDGTVKEFAAALRYARDNGVLVVAAAGNESADVHGRLHGVYDDTTKYTSPRYSLPCRDRALFANLLCVAATDGSEKLAWFSNWGKPEVQVAAPGAEIIVPTVADPKFVNAFPGVLPPSGYPLGDLADPAAGVLATQLPGATPTAPPVNGTFDRSGVFVRRDQLKSPFALENGTSFAAPITAGAFSLLEACLRVPTLAERKASPGKPWYETLLAAMKDHGVREEFKSLFGRRSTPLKGKVDWNGRIDLDLLFDFYGSKCVPRSSP